MNIEFGKFLCPQESVLGVVFGSREKSVLQLVEFFLRELPESAVFC